MNKQTEYTVLGIGIISIVFALFGAYRSGDIMEGWSGLFIGISLIGLALIERSKRKKSE